MIDIKVNHDKGYPTVIVDGKDVTKGCTNVGFDISAHEVPTVTVTYAVKNFEYDGKKLYGE